MAEYVIHEDLISKLETKLQSIKKKCGKYGCTFHYAIVREEYQEVLHENGNKYTERFVVVEVEGIAKVNDWKFVATLEHGETGNIIRSYDTEVEIPLYYRSCEPKCDHCHSNRFRKDTYIIQNEVTKEFKQVGKSCLKDFTNGLSAEMIAQYLSYFTTLEELSSSGNGGSGYIKYYLNTKEYLTAVVEVVNKCGFISRTKSQEEDKEATSALTNRLLHPCNKCDKENIERLDFVADRAENKTAVEEMLTWIELQDSNNQYIYNLQTACQREYAEYRDMGLLASLPSAYFKAMETEKERLVRESRNTTSKVSEYVGNIGDKLELMEVEINRVSSIDTVYGLMNIYKIVDKNSNTYVWKTGKTAEKEKSIEDYTSLKGTIKEYEEYRGEKQTVLTRCKVF